MGFTQALDNEILDHLLSRAAMTLNPTTFYIGLSTSLPTNVGGNFVEPVGNGYARKGPLNNDATMWPAASAGSKSNGSLVVFDQATGSWGTVGWFGIFSALSGGVPIFWGPLTSTKTPASGDTLKFPIGTLVVSQA
jgi:hypothetical protein